MALPEWIKQALVRDEFSFVLFQYDDIPQSDLTSGQRDASNSTRLWQEQLYTGLFRVPDPAVPRIHPRTPAGEPDALSFEYRTSGYAVKTFAVMNRLALLITPDDETRGSLRMERDPIETVANKIARAIVVYPGQVDLLAETQHSDGVYGRQKLDASKKQEERSPLDLMHWWYANGTFGFVTWLVTPVVGGNYPSTAFVSPQQVYVWFDTYGMRRVKP